MMAIQAIHEPARDVNVFADYDVVVVGGGIAGICAAVASARAGARTLLMEKEYALGGLATLGNVLIYLPLCDGCGNQVIGGLGEELMHLSLRDVRKAESGLRLQPVPDCWGADGDPEARKQTRLQTSFNPASLILEAETWIQDAGVDLLYDARFAGVAKEDAAIFAVLFESKSGRMAVTCRSVVDCSGDADVCAAAGEPTESLDTNVASGWHYQIQDGQVKLQCMTRPYSPKATREGATGPFYRGDDVAQVTAQVLDTRGMVRERLKAAREKHPDSSIHPFQLATFPSFRMTRRLRGTVEIAEADDKRWFEDSIGMSGDWRKRGPIYYIPLRALAGVRTPNLLVAGRCISNASDIWDALRVIPTCAVTGEAAGAAAAMAVRETAGMIPDLPVAKVQDYLRAQNVIIDKGHATCSEA